MVTIPWRARFHSGQGTPQKASLHRTRWNASLQSRTAWKPSSHWEERTVLTGFVRRAMPLEGRVPPRSKTHTAAASRRSPCAAATSHGAFDFAERLECACLLALSDDCTAAGHVPPHPCFPQATGLSGKPTASSVRGPGSTPARAGCTRTGGLGLKTAKLRLQSSSPSAAAEVTGGGQKTAPLGSVNSSQKAAIQFVRPSTFARFVPVSAAGALRD